MVTARKSFRPVVGVDKIHTDVAPVLGIGLTWISQVDIGDGANKAFACGLEKHVLEYIDIIGV